MQQQFVIVGANLAGGTSAIALREGGFEGKIVLIGAEPQLPYERPPLSKEYLQGRSRSRRPCSSRPLFTSNNAGSPLQRRTLCPDGKRGER